MTASVLRRSGGDVQTDLPAREAGILDALDGGEGRTARTVFFLACSHSALAFLKGKEGDALLGRASQEFAEAARLGPVDGFDQRWISPRIIRVYEEARRSAPH